MAVRAGFPRALFAVALVLSVIGVPQGPSNAQACDDIAAYQKLVNPADGGWSGVTVPIVIHIMERPTPGHDACDVRERWTRERVSLVFGPSNDDPRGVNSVWGPVGIRFVIREIARHEYVPPEGLLTTVPPGPRGSPTFEAGFNLVAHRFHRPGSINVYLWDRLDGPSTPMGYGRSPKSGGGKATVWLDRVCMNLDLMVKLENCARNVAHELGHALGLYHIGAHGCDGALPDDLPTCQLVSPSCPEVEDKDRLMAARIVGDRKLCPAEVTEAKATAAHLK